eukprot:Seg1673.2 transcript_id=Seg1673.2/GoldUCD/mRNA.D3Y31 product="Zinc metalloproteinase-disintegrin-like VLAIP-A" protein_id=Seg1673.2/GoldUCD/D3Y31
MGHNLGMQHDQSQCRCTDRLRSCLMSPYAQNPISTTFSSCSVQYLVKYLRTNRAGCLMNVPKKGLFYEEKTCGNNKLDRGEDCDCGYPNFCKNPCCNAATCKLTPGSQCYSGACCKKCTISRKGDVCRPSADGVCDLEETCDGVNNTCPDNFFHMNGKDCYQHGHAGYTTPDCHEPIFDCSYTTPSHPALRITNLSSLTTAKPKWSGVTSDWCSYTSKRSGVTQDWCSYTRWNAERSASDSFSPHLQSGVVSLHENGVE